MAVFEMNLCDVYHLFILYCNIVILYKNKITVYVIFSHTLYILYYVPAKGTSTYFSYALNTRAPTLFHMLSSHIASFLN